MRNTARSSITRQTGKSSRRIQLMTCRTYAFIAVPRIMALKGFPQVMASGTFFRYNAPMPSARAYPSADTSKVWQIDVGDTAPSFVVSSCPSGPSIKLLPTTMAESQSPHRRAVTAICKAYIEDEHAVSKVTLSCSKSIRHSKNELLTSFCEPAGRNWKDGDIPRAFQIENIIDSIAYDRDTASSRRIWLKMIAISDLHKFMIVIKATSKHSCSRARECFPCLSSIFKCLIYNFQELPLGRIHGRCL